MKKLIIRRKPSWLFRHRTNLNVVDMHVHTTYSDGNFGVKKLIRRCLRKRIGVCVCDHNQIKGSVEICKSSVFSVPSIELTSKEYIDLLVYFYSLNDLKDFYSKYVKGCRIVPAGLDFKLLKWSVADLFKRLKDYNCLNGLAHPDAAEPQNALRFFNSNVKLIKDIDAVEVMNSLHSYKRNRKALEFAHKFGKRLIGGSDAHTLRGVGMAVTVSDGYDVDRFLDNIFKGRNFVRGRPLVGGAWLQNVFMIGKDILLFKKRV